MLIEVRTDGNTKGSEQSYAQVKAEVHAALDRYADHIRRVDVHLSDAIGNKAGHDDKCCMIEAHRDGREPIVVKHQESTLEQAIQGAYSQPEKVGRKRLRKRDHPGSSPGSSLGT
jgi:hypothetical protein